MQTKQSRACTPNRVFYQALNIPRSSICFPVSSLDQVPETMNSPCARSTLKVFKLANTALVCPCLNCSFPRKLQWRPIVSPWLCPLTYPVLPWCASPVVWHAPSSWGSWVTNHLFNGSSLSCWPHSFFLSLSFFPSLFSVSFFPSLFLSCVETNSYLNELLSN